MGPLHLRDEMRVLVLDEEFPYPLNSGKRIRSFQLLSRQVNRCEIFYLAYGAPGSESFAAFEKAGMHPLAVPKELPPQSGPEFYFRLLANLFSSEPYIVARHYSKEYQTRLNAAVDEIKPDLILCEWTPYAVFLRDIVDIPRVVNAQNIERHIWERYYEWEESALKRWYIGRQVPKVLALEQEVFGWLEGAMAVSTSEAAEITALNPQIPVAVVENGVDLDYFFPTQGINEEAELVFVGAMHWRPNQDAVIYFVDEIFPRIQQQRPGVVFTIVGQEPPPHIRRLEARPGVRVTGGVEDVRPYVSKAAVYVVPLRIGGGTRLKILEALAMKKAVIATTVGAEGLEVADDRHLLLADSADQFADKVVRLLDDADLRRQLGDEGRKLVEDKYSWNRLADKFYDCLVSIVEKHKNKQR